MDPQPCGRLDSERPETPIYPATNFLNQTLASFLLFRLTMDLGLSNSGTIQHLLGFLECCWILERAEANQDLEEGSEDTNQLDGITQPQFVAIFSFSSPAFSPVLLQRLGNKLIGIRSSDSGVPEMHVYTTFSNATRLGRHR
jgi:hypothetical protein